MVSEQVIVSAAIAKAVVEATRAAIQAMAVATVERSQSAAGPKIGGPAMKQPTFSWELDNKCNELKTFRVEVNNISSTYYLPQTEHLAIVKNWLERKGLQVLESLSNEETLCTAYLQHLPANLDCRTTKP